MNTHTPHLETVEARLIQLERTNARWRIVSFASIALIAGVLIGGMGNNSAQPADDAKADAKYVGTADTIYRINDDGSINYLRIPAGERTGNGYFSWGDIKIDKTYKSRDLPQ